MKLPEYFKSLRMGKKHHLGLGDIRLTMGQQEEIEAYVAQLEARAEAAEASDEIHANAVEAAEAESERLQKELNKLHCRITIFECNWDMGGHLEPLKFWEKSWRYIDELVPPEHQLLTWCNEYEQALGGE